jgi:hypothetical protein
MSADKVVLVYCEMNGNNLANASSVGGWMLLDTNFLNIYDDFIGVTLNNMTRNGSQYDADAVDGYLRTIAIPLPKKSRGIRIDFMNLENINNADGGLNRAALSDVYAAGNGTSVFLGTDFNHFGVSAHGANNIGNTYVSLSTMVNVQNTVQGVAFFGNQGTTNKRANVGNVYFLQTDDIGFDMNKLIISQSDGSSERINIRDLRIWIR